jgi:tetratricopeptide (TPR) repeat protein
VPSPLTATARRLAPLAALALGIVLPVAPAAAAPGAGIAGPYLAAQHASRLGDPVAAAEHYAEALARDPDDAMLLERTLLHRLAAGQVAEAVPVARRVDEVSPGGHLSVVALAAEEIRTGAHARAAGRLAAEEDRRGRFVVGLMEAWAELGAGDRAGALAVLDALEEDGAGGPAGRFLAGFHRGLVFAAEGDDEGAVRALENAREEAGSLPRRLALALSGALARLGRTDEAGAVLEERLALSLSDPRLRAARRELDDGAPEPLVSTASEGAAEALFGLSRYLMRGRTELTGVAYARLATHLRPDLVDAHLLIAEQMLSNEQYALASEAYRAVPEDAPEALDARIGLANALEGEADVDAAVTALREATRRWPREIDVHRALGDMLRRNSRFEEAAEAYDGAIALIDEPENRHWPLYYSRGIALERSDQWPRAEEDFRTALELEPDQPLVLNYLGYSWVEMGRNLAEAQEMIEKAVEQRPEDGYIVDSLGWVLYRLGDFEGAVEHLGRAVELRPVDPVINDHYGDALWMVGREVEAEFQWRRSLSFEPEPEVEERILRKLDVGLDVVLEEEAAAGEPAIIGRSEPAAADGNDGG